MDDRDRDKFYSAPLPASDDEYELEEPDEEAEERRRQAVAASRPPVIDVDALYTEAERDYGGELLENWVRNFRLRAEHLFIAPAVLVIAVALVQLKLFWTAVIVLVMAFVGGLYFYLTLQERQRQAELDRQRDELYAKRRKHFAARAPGALPDPESSISAAATAVEQSFADDDHQEPTAAREPFRLQFSLRSVAVIIAILAAVLGMTRWLGGPDVTAATLGLIALVGLIVYATDAQPPWMVVLTWWLALLLYLAMSALASATGAFA